jgi:hypothetical protein
MDFLEKGLKSKEKEQRFMKIKIRVKSLFESFIDNCASKNFPQPLLIFLTTFFSENSS